MTPREILFGIERALGPQAWADYGRWWKGNVQKDERAAAIALNAYERRRSGARTAPIHNVNKWLESVYNANVRKAVAA